MNLRQCKCGIRPDVKLCLDGVRDFLLPYHVGQVLGRMARDSTRVF